MKHLTTFTRAASAISVALLLGACGDASTNITELPPEITQPDHDDHDHGDDGHDHGDDDHDHGDDDHDHGDDDHDHGDDDHDHGDDDHDHGDDDHDHDHAEMNAGRLVISELGGGEALVWDLQNAEELGHFDANGTISAVYTAPGHRYVALMQRNDNQVQFVDSGLWQENHGDHLHDYVQAPAMVDFAINGEKPTHVGITEEQFAIFFDGNGEADVPASIGVFTQENIAHNEADYPTYAFNRAMHGAAQPRGQYLVTGVSTAENESPLPDQVAVLEQHDDHFDEMQVFEEACPALHGSAQTHHHVAFGCGDGVLLVTQEGSNFSAAKIAEPADFAEDARIGTLYSDAHHDLLVGYARPNILVSIDEAGMTPIDWQAEEGAAPLTVKFADDGHKMIILDSTGHVTILHEEAEGEWHVEGQIHATESDVTTMPEGARFELVLSGVDDKAYMTDPISSELITIDLETMSVEGHVDLEFVPGKLAWTGIMGEAGDRLN